MLLPYLHTASDQILAVVMAWKSCAAVTCLCMCVVSCIYVATAVCAQEKTEEEKDREAEAQQEMKVWFTCRCVFH